jgi:hypothetical protein
MTSVPGGGLNPNANPGDATFFESGPLSALADGRS